MSLSPASDQSPAQAIIAKLEERIALDEGGRGMKHLVIKGQLALSAQQLIEAQRVVIVTGFPCLVHHWPPTETDGPAGAFAIARAVAMLGHTAIICTDSSNQAVFEAGMAKLQQHIGGSQAGGSCQSFETSARSEFAKSTTPGRILLEIFTCRKDADPCTLKADRNRMDALATTADHVVAVERAGPASDGRCYSMKGIDLSPLLAPLEHIIYTARHHNTFSTGIGDGGNECGMGKVLDKVHQFIPRGGVVGCVVPTDNLIAASVSNWGAYALAAAMKVLSADAADTTIGHNDLLLKTKAPAHALTGPNHIAPSCGAGTGAGDSQAASAATLSGAGGKHLQKELRRLLDSQGSGTSSGQLHKLQADEPQPVQKLQKRILASSLQEREQIQAQVDAGCRDGLTGEMALSVDGMPLSASLACLKDLHTISAASHFLHSAHQLSSLEHPPASSCTNSSPSSSTALMNSFTISGRTNSRRFLVSGPRMPCFAA